MKASHPEPTTAELLALRAFIRAQQCGYRRRLLGMCPECLSAMEPAPAHKAEPDTGRKAFAGGHRCTDCGFEVEDN